MSPLTSICKMRFKCVAVKGGILCLRFIDLRHVTRFESRFSPELLWPTLGRMAIICAKIIAILSTGRVCTGIKWSRKVNKTNFSIRLWRKRFAILKEDTHWVISASLNFVKPDLWTRMWYSVVRGRFFGSSCTLFDYNLTPVYGQVGHTRGA